MKLDIGYKADFEIRKASVQIQNAVDFTVLYLSDLHLNRFSQPLVEQIIQSIESLNPTIILFGGDYVDTHKGLYYFEKLLDGITPREHIFAIAGNHDDWFGLLKIKNVCAKYAIKWMENCSEIVDIKGFKIQITDKTMHQRLKNADFNILCLHQPIDITPFHDHFNLVFAGHLHGCQVVFWENEKGLFPGKWFYKWNILKTQIGDCLYIVSKGLGDTLPLRFNCRKDMILVEISK
jgi:uncharacterized protein